MFYLNAHILMAYALILMTAGIFVARHRRALTPDALSLILVGGIIGVTARIEGFVLVGISLVALASEPWWRGISRWRLAVTTAAIGITLSWWLGAVGSDVPNEFGISLWLIPLLSVGGAVLIASHLIDRVRPYLISGLGIVLVGILVREVALSRDPITASLAQWPNLGLGEGGWATAAWVWVAGLFILGWKGQSEDYRRLVVLSALFIGAILFAKTFDGGFGREGFFDSVNRMFLHVMPVIATASLLGFGALLGGAFRTQAEKSVRIPSTTSPSTIGGKSHTKEGV